MAMSFFGFALSTYAKARPVLEAAAAEQPAPTAVRPEILAVRPSL